MAAVKSIEELMVEIDLLCEDARANFGTLNYFQLNWAPSEKEWGVGQIFEHLLIMNESYVFDLERKINRKEGNSFRESTALISRLMGRWMLKNIGPNSTKIMKSPKKFKPSGKRIRKTIIWDFIEQQQLLKGYMEESLQQINVNKVRITSPVSSFYTFSILEVFNLIVLHEQRHLQQAKRVMEMPAFQNIKSDGGDLPAPRQGSASHNVWEYQGGRS